MPSGYLKNTEGVSERTGRGSSSKDGKTVKGGGRHSPQHSPKGRRLSPKPTKDGSNGGSGAQRGKSSGGGGDGAEGTSDIGGVSASGSSGRRSSPKFRGPAASNPTKSLVREVDRDVEPTAVAHARVTGLRLKVSANLTQLGENPPIPPQTLHGHHCHHEGVLHSKKLDSFF